jgi:O-antigen ligase
VYAFIDIICCVLLVSGEIKNDDNKLKVFFTVYAFVALAAYLTGTICGNELEQIERPGFEIVEYSRFMATFEDPNYMGFFYTVAVFAVFTLKLFKPLYRILIIIALNIMMLTSLSITAIIVNAVLWLVYLVVSKKMTLKALIVIVVVVFLMIAAYNYGLGAGKDSFLGNLAYRIQEKIQELKRNNIGAATTGRSDLAAYHFEIYKSQPIFKMLFGGLSSNTYYIDPILGNAAHNEYVDLLLNIGLIGSLIMLGFFAYNLFVYYKEYLKGKNEKYLFLIMGKLIWVLYAFTLTMFLDYRFMFFFLI